MNSDIKENIFIIALEAKQWELEQARMQLEDQQAKIIEATDKLKELKSLLEYLHPNHDGTHVQPNA